MKKVHYNKHFFSEMESGSSRSAGVLIPLVKELCAPGSVADIGCGTGNWLQVWQEQGVKDIAGFDGSYIDSSALKIDPAFFHAVDLEEPIKIKRRYDLVQCLEVAEHLQQPAAATLVHSLCQLSDVVLFSAAIPGQGGTNHINEQYPDYWTQLFGRENFLPFDCLRAKIWDNSSVDTCYRQNILFFIQINRIQDYPLITAAEQKILSLVHPDTFAFHLRELDHHRKILRSPFHANWYFVKKYTRQLLTKLGLWK